MLGQALWALYHSESLLDGLNRLLAIQASPPVLSTFCCLAGLCTVLFIGIKYAVRCVAMVIQR